MRQNKIKKEPYRYPFIVKQCRGPQHYLTDKQCRGGFGWSCKTTGLRGVMVFIWWGSKCPDNIRVGIGKSTNSGKSEILQFSVLPPNRLIVGKNFLSAKQTELVKKWINLNQRLITNYWNNDDVRFFGTSTERCKKV